MFENSPILAQVVDIQPCAPSCATHFALCNGRRLRYLIALRGGCRPLTRSVASYGGKLALLMRMLPLLPYRLMAAAHLGFFARTALHPAVQSLLPQDRGWNLLVGTYDAKQKLVVQAFSADGADCLFAKIGNEATEAQMKAEMRFLQQEHACFHRVQVPELVSAAYRAEGAPFNVQVTREFRGAKVPAVLTEDIVALYREIAGETQHIGGQPCEFSHGDFTPWNLRRTETGYIVFDWEHCGMKPQGYDLVYFGVVTRLACRGLVFDAAFEEALTDIRRYIPDFKMDKDLFYRLFTSVITPDGF